MPRVNQLRALNLTQTKAHGSFSHRLIRLLLLFLSAVAITPPATADVLFTGGLPTGNEKQILFSPASGQFQGLTPHGPSYLITGFTSDGLPVNVTTNNYLSQGVDHLYGFFWEVFSNQWVYPGEDLSLNQLTITMPGYTFQDIMLYVYGMLDNSTSAHFTVVTNDGTFEHTYQNLGPTYNQIFITTVPGESIQSVSVSNTEFSALKYFYISTPTPQAPEPSTLLLLGSGLLGWWRLRGRTVGSASFKE